ncbi:MAG: glycosyltransferase family 2 protein [Butyrivibrio sp.]|nr:glycosyltransferase family 2 protein [Butyrivibrio sp.]
MSKRLSVIVPVYNMAADDKLKWCLDSLVHQTLPDEDIEIIAVDDASTDNSFALMKEYEQQYPGRFIAVHSPVNHHQGGAKNIGLTIAGGEWIGFIDADDWVTADYYEVLLKKADETGADMVGCDYSLVNSHTMEVGQVVHNNTFEQTGVMDKEKYRKLLLDTGSLVVKIYKRELVFGELDPAIQGANAMGSGSASDFWQQEVYEKRVHIFPEDIFYEDNAISNTWMLRSKHFEYIQEPLYYYYQHDASTVHTISKKNLEDRMVAGRMILEQAHKYGYFEDYKEEIEFMYIVLFYVNTLFSAMPIEQHIQDRYNFCRQLGEEMKATFPEFEKNKYYQERVHAEEKKLIHMQMRSHAQFYAYYRMLWAYRGIRRAHGFK